MEQEILNEGYVPAENKINVLIGVKRKSDDTLWALTKEQYESIGAETFDVEGIIVRDAFRYVDLLFSPQEKLSVMGEGPIDIPEMDIRRMTAPKNPTFQLLDGQWCTQWQLNEHPDNHDNGCAICEAVKFGWLPSNGEMTKAIERKELFDEVAKACGCDGLENEAYWCSTQYSPDYMWSYDMEMKSFIFWKSRTTAMGIRPVKSASDYNEVEG